MQKNIFISFLGVILALFLLASCSDSANDVSTHNDVNDTIGVEQTDYYNDNSDIDDIVPESEEWVNYKNEDFDFEIDIPAGSSVETMKDTNFDRVRIQNYSSTDALELTEGQYYLEIFLQKNEDVDENEISNCTGEMTNVEEIQVDDMVVYKGDAMRIGDTGGESKTLCFEVPEGFITITGTENHPGTPLINKIFDSLSL